MGCIATKPVRAYRTPTYPTKLQVLDNVDLLRRHIPSAWLGNKELAALAGVFLCANTVGCADEGTATSKPGKLTKDAAAVVAPVFEHGNGTTRSRGMFGCDAVTSPVFLSEAEALQIIADELALHGIELSQKDVVLPFDVVLRTQYSVEHNWLRSRDEVKITPINEPLEMDLYDPTRKIGIEFVCLDDFDSLGGDDRSHSCTNVKKVAVSVANAVKDKGRNVYFGAFYDPIPHLDYSSFYLKHSSSEGKERAELVTAESPAEDDSSLDFKAEAKELLRQQVKDFADWLKGQGII